MNFGVDHSSTTFTAEGALKQCDDAMKAALNGTLSLGAQSSDGIVLASLKTFPALVESERVRKVFQVCDSIGITYCGLMPDFSRIYDLAVQIAEEYYYIYERYPYVDVFTKNLSRVIQEQTMKKGFRPFGNLLLVAGYIQEKEVEPVLYQLEPSGSFQETNVCGIGKEYKNATQYLSSRLEELDDNIVSTVAALQEFSGYSLEAKNVDIGVFKTTTKRFEIYSLEEIQEVIDSLKTR